MKIFVAVCLAFILVEAKKKECNLKCSKNDKQKVCGKDGVTYKSFCHLQLQSCHQGKDIGFACDGTCPCDPPEVFKMDQETVKKIQEARSLYQLQKHEKEELNSADTFLARELLGEDDLKRHIALKVMEHDKKQECELSEMAELPTRLIDWFHVLRINEKVEDMRIQRIEGEPIMKEENFSDEKMKSMYTELACSDHKDQKVEKAVCLKPVQWMFHHLDANGDNHLSASELSDIEDIQNEKCIKPFLQSCDHDKDGKVELAEFCRCLCVSPPCTNVIKNVPILMVRGQPAPMPGFFVPRCDDDGFFMPEQCNPMKECWCVDRNGGELLGTRTKKGSATCDSYNTKNPSSRLVPLNINNEQGH